MICPDATNDWSFLFKKQLSPLFPARFCTLGCAKIFPNHNISQFYMLNSILNIIDI